MAFSTTNPGPIDRHRQEGEVISVLMTASTIIKKGNIIIITAATGTAHPMLIDTTPVTAGDVFAGIAMEDKTSAATGSTYVRVYTSGIFTLTAAAADETNIGQRVWADGTAAGGIDAVTVTDGDAAQECSVGFIVGFPLNTAGTAVRVLIRPFERVAA